jgi:N-acetylmuramoyl-L-alanine amidase
MKALLMLLFLMAGLTAEARLSLQHLNRTVISGSDYIRLADWADSVGFTMKWAKKDGTITLSSPSAQLALGVDKRRAEISGVNVWLALPVVNRNGTVFLSVVDAARTIGPILFPQKSEGRLKTICLDPGHGGKDKGTISGGNYEKNYSLLLAREVAGLLKQEGLKVFLTREGDASVDLPDRPLKARRDGADLFVSLHYNAASRDLRGLEVFCLAPAGVNSSNEGGGKASHQREAGNAHDDQNVLLAYAMQKAITASVPLEDLGMKRSRFEVLCEACMPAILIEGGFMSNAADARNIYDTAFRKRMAQAIVNGILAYKKMVERL